LQALLQQKPSMHWPEMHSLPEAQAWPLAAGSRHTPVTQTWPVAHWLSMLQSPAHWVLPHWNGAQLERTSGGQEPAPLQNAGTVATSLAQAASRQLTPAPGYSQVKRVAPLQVPAHWPPSLLQGARPPTGSPVTALHRPSLPATLQASHCWVQGPSQHTPSTQLPVAHWFPAAHTVPPASLSTHTPAEQYLPL